MHAKTSVLALLFSFLAGTQGFAQKKDMTTVWVNTCAKCHGMQGNARDASGHWLSIRGEDFTNTRKMSRVKDSKLVSIILKGHKDMPSFKGKLTPAEAQQIVTEIIRPFSASK